MKAIQQELAHETGLLERKIFENPLSEFQYTLDKKVKTKQVIAGLNL